MNNEFDRMLDQFPKENFIPAFHTYYGKNNFYYPQVIFYSPANTVDYVPLNRIFAGAPYRPFCPDAEIQWGSILNRVQTTKLSRFAARIDEVALFLPTPKSYGIDRLSVGMGTVLFKNSPFGQKTGLTIIDGNTYITTGLYNNLYDGTELEPPMVLLARASTLPKEDVELLTKRITEHTPPPSFLRQIKSKLKR